MALIATLAVIAVLFWRAHVLYERTGRQDVRVRRAALSWAAIGALLGSHAGIVMSGMGGISGAIPCALVGYAAAFLLMRARLSHVHPNRWAVSGGALIGALLGSETGIAALGGATNGWWAGALAGALAAAVAFPRRSSNSSLWHERRARLRRLAAKAGQAVPVLIVCGMGYVSWVRHEDAKALNEPVASPAPAPAGVLPMVAASSPAAPRAKSPEELAYDAAVRSLEAEYPELNPDRPEYNQALVDAVFQLANHHVRSGVAPAAAVRLAVADLLPPKSSSASPTQSRRVTPDPDRQRQINQTLCSTWPDACRR